MLPDGSFTCRAAVLQTEGMIKSSKFILMWGVLAILVGCRRASKQEVWIIPGGYVGWLRLDYSVKGESPLDMENGRYIIRVPRTGRVRTSTANRPPIIRNKYSSEGPNGPQDLAYSPRTPGYAIQNAFSFGRGKLGSGFPQPEAECVFVGTQTDFRLNGRDCMSWKPGQSGPPKFAKRKTAP